MKKTIGILLLAAVLVFSLTSCGGGGGGSSGISGVINKITGKSNSITYSFANSNFGFKTGGANEEHFRFTSATAVSYTLGVNPPVTKIGTYTDVSTKSGALTITFTDGTTLTRTYEFTDDGNKVTGVMLNGLAFTKY